MVILYKCSALSSVLCGLLIYKLRRCTFNKHFYQSTLYITECYVGSLCMYVTLIHVDCIKTAKHCFTFLFV